MPRGDAEDAVRKSIRLQTSPEGGASSGHNGNAGRVGTFHGTLLPDRERVSAMNRSGPAAHGPFSCWGGRSVRHPDVAADPVAGREPCPFPPCWPDRPDRKSTRLNSSHVASSYAVFCLEKKIRR